MHNLEFPNQKWPEVTAKPRITSPKISSGINSKKKSKAIHPFDSTCSLTLRKRQLVKTMIPKLGKSFILVTSLASSSRYVKLDHRPFHDSLLENFINLVAIKGIDEEFLALWIMGFFVNWFSAISYNPRGISHVYSCNTGLTYFLFAEYFLLVCGFCLRSLS